MKYNTKRISVTHVATVKIQLWGFISPVPTAMPVFKICALDIILLMLCTSFSMADITMTRFLLVYGTDPEPIVHI